MIYMKSRQSDRKTTKQVRIDSGYHRLLRIEAAKTGKNIKEVLEGYILDGLGQIRDGGEYDER